MKFRERINPDGTTEYAIGKTSETMKVVTEDTYKKLFEDDTSDNITMPKICTPEIECSEAEFCPECQEILDIIDDLCSTSDEEAIGAFKSIIVNNRQEAFIEGLISAYNEMGNNSHKIASKLELQLESMRDAYEEDEETN